MATQQFDLAPVDLRPGAPDAALAGELAGVWNAACGAGLHISGRTMAYNLQAAGGAEASCCLAQQDGQVVGFVAVSAVIDPATGLEPTYGWIDALAVAPEAQRQGAGGQLLAWGERWLRARGCTLARLAGGLRPFAAGLPVEMGGAEYGGAEYGGAVSSEAGKAGSRADSAPADAASSAASFFEKRGYAGYPGDRQVWDVGHSLSQYSVEPRRPGRPAEARPLQDGEQAALADFFRREFPGRWQYEFDEHVRQGGRLSDYLALWMDGRPEGFCQVTFEDSQRPIDRFFPHGLPRPWGQLGPIGVGAACRGHGMGGFLLDAGLRYLKSHGVDGCVIDWTDLPEFYIKFGFHLHRQYLVLHKELA